MKFEIAHTFAVTPEQYEAVYFDEAFGVAQCEAVSLGRTLLKLEKTDTRIVRHVRIEPAREIPGPIAKLIGNAKIAYVEEIDYDVTKRAARWRTVPNIAADKIETAGTFEFLAAGTGTNRIVRGDITVKVFGLGGVIEKFIVEDVKKSYEKAAAFTRDWIAKR